MSLQSKLFRGDAKLEAAAVSDAAHIAPGASGPHVGKIQQALIVLDGAALQKDSRYGPATAAAVLAYKRKREIINRSRQSQADNIVGIMTMAVLDREMLAKEALPTRPLEIVVVSPRIRAVRPTATMRLGFVIDVDFPIFPGGNLQRMRLEPRSTGKLEILHGASGKIRCKNVVPTIGNADSEKISFIFDPSAPNFLPVTRLNPQARGPLAGVPFEDGGLIQITNDAFSVMVDALHPGDAFLDASTATSANTVVLEVRAPKLGPAAGTPPTKTRAGSTLISSKDSEANVSGRNAGRPVNPKGTGRKINIFGSGETPGFEDYTADMAFTTFSATGQSANGSTADERFRPWTEDGDSAVRIGDGTVSDICIRDSPIKPLTITVIRRIAQPKCRLTFSATEEGAKSFLPVLKAGLPGARILEEFPDAIVMELP